MILYFQNIAFLSLNKNDSESQEIIKKYIIEDISKLIEHKKQELERLQIKKDNHSKIGEIEIESNFMAKELLYYFGNSEDIILGIDPKEIENYFLELA